MTEMKKEGFLETLIKSTKRMMRIGIAAGAAFLGSWTAKAEFPSYVGPGYVQAGRDGHGSVRHVPVNSNPHGISFYSTGGYVSTGAVGYRGGYVGGGYGPYRGGYAPAPRMHGGHHHHHGFWHYFGRDLAHGAAWGLGNALVDTVIGGSSTVVVGGGVPVVGTTIVTPTVHYGPSPVVATAPVAVSQPVVVQESRGLLGAISDWWNGDSKNPETQAKERREAADEHVAEVKAAAAKAEAAAARSEAAATTATNAAVKAERSMKAAAAYADFVSQTTIKLKTQKPAVSAAAAKAKQSERQ